MKINANMSALITNKQLLRIEGNMSASMERLSTGFKINHAKDNPAGIAISNKMRAQIAGLDRSSNNASDAIAAVRIADGALNETTSILQRMRELSVQAANGTNTLEDRQAIQQEIDSLKEEVNRISRDTEYNEMTMLDGSLCNRVYAENVSRISTSDEVPAGIYKLSNVEVGTQAKIPNSLAVDKTSTGEFGEEGSVSVNGYSVEINKDDTEAEVYEKIRHAAEIGGAELKDDGSMVSVEYGETATIKLSFSSLELATALGYDSAGLEEDTNGEYVYGTRGTDAELMIDPTSAFDSTATVTADGNRVRITDKYGFEMSFLIDSEFQGDELEFEVTDIGTMTIHIGANKDQNMVMSIPEISTESLYIDNVNVTTMGGADKAMSALSDAISQVSAARSKLGAYENRLDYSVNSLDAFEENMTEAQSRLTDTDMAKEMTTYTQQNVLNQAAISVLAQANDMPQQVLQLLQ